MLLHNADCKVNCTEDEGMTRARELKEKARLIPGGSVVEKRSATIAIRPLRLAFVININTSQETLIKHLAYNASVWGGIYNCLIPTDGQSLRDDWWAALRRHDPDKVVFCGEKTPELMKQVQDEIQPFALWEWYDGVAKEHKMGLDGFGNIPLRFVLWQIYESEKPITQSNIRLPMYRDESPFRLCVAAQLGALDGELAKIYVEGLRAEHIDLGNTNLESYLTNLSEFSGRHSPLDITKWNLSTLFEAGSIISGFNLVLCDNDSVADICLFWNLRMAAAIESKGTLLLPIDMLRSRNNLQALADWCNKNVRGTNHLTLASATVNKRRMVRLRDRFKKLLDGRFQFVDVWYTAFSIGQFLAYETQSREEIVIEDRAFSLRKPLPSLGERVRSGMEWVVDVDLRGFPRLGQGYIPPRYPRLNHLLAGEPPNIALQLGRGYWLRLAQNRLAFRVGRSRQEYIRARLPEEERLFVSLLSNKGYHSHTTDKCRYTRGIIRLLGYKDAEILREAGLRDLLCAMQGGRVYTPSEMKQFLKPGGKVSQHQRVGELVADLALKGVFLRGYNIRCPACDLRRWYSVHDVAESMECAGCLARLQPPIEAPFQYKLNELMVRGIEQGIIPLMLTILTFSALGDESFLFLPGIEVKRDNDEVDIDLLAACNGNLVLAECKDLHGGCSPEATQEIIEQLSGIVQVALEVGARIVFLGTLLDHIPQDLEQGVNCLREQHKDVAIHVMLKADLERGYKAKPAGRFLSPDDSDRQVPVCLEDLFPKRRAAKPGWVREPGQRMMTF